MDDQLVASFMDLTACSSRQEALHFLSASNWRLNDAVNLFYTDGAPNNTLPDPAPEEAVRPPISARTETLYAEGASMYGARDSRNRTSIWAPPPQLPGHGTTRWATGEHVRVDHSSMEETPQIPVTWAECGITATGWESPVEHNEHGGHYNDDEGREDYASDYDYSLEEEEEAPAVPQNSLAQLFRPPYEMMFSGSFHDAKVHAAREGRWLVANVQSPREFASHAQNRDLWAVDVVAQMARDNFIFWQAKKQHDGDEGSKVCCFYNLGDKLPAVLVIDPLTGQKMAMWCGHLDPNDFLLNMGKFTESKPYIPKKPQKEAGTSEAAAEHQKQEPSPESKPTKPLAHIQVPVVEEPIDTIMYKLRIRFPDGRLVPKEFGSRQRVAALFAYCRSVLNGGGTTGQPFQLKRFVGCSFAEITKVDASFEELGLNACTISVFLVLS